MKKIIVIGAGVGGSACAALLKKAGHQVVVLERHGFAGGRCSAFSQEDFRYDFGVHMFSRGERGPHGEINRRLGGNLRWITRDPASRVIGRNEFDFPLNIKSLWRQYRLAGDLGVKIKNYAGGYRMLRSLFSGRNAEANDGARLSDYVSRHTDDERLHLFINCLSQLYFALSYHQASAGEFIWCFSRMFKDASFGYPAGGSGRIAETFIDALKRNGGTVHYDSAVKRIIVENGRAVGVETASGEYQANVVISSAGMKTTVDLAGASSFPEWYVEQAGRYRYSNPYVTIKYILEKPVIPYPVVFCMPDLPADRVFEYIEKKIPPEDPYIFMPVPSNHDPSLAGNGRQLVIAGTAAPPGASAELSNAILDAVHRKVCALFPQIEKYLCWQSRSTCRDIVNLTGHPAGEAIGIGQFPGQAGGLRPGHTTPIEGLYLVGADAGARGIGTEMAAASALNLAGQLS